ncbi:TAXI family TRAP transporter solute-binding subunit [Paraburkholderia pallida]|uniref:C4-dicarboxylate ABC transporter substrate-binding protein n=1 Tax=Paraburkholderia pallida TaxID=2547399 RepID=A0A4P7D0S3_9BURK|nr:TAXI family TRAP transporter solute-binding subunit [Paraburkholderia pallida]QBR00215.1 C4-dicarboxylate ABC transporter substrate-binding protein [Paraburkholderia pallida]
MKRHRQPLPHFMRDPSHPAWRDLALTTLPIALFCIVVVAVFVWLVDPAPPRSITISAGPRDSSFMQMAEAYRTILARNGVKLKILESDGSVQNLQRLLDPKAKVDLAFVQGGVADGLDTRSLVSLGSVAYLPIVVFYRGSGLTQLAALDGKRIAIGRVGSGTRELSLKLLDANGMEPGGDSTFLPLDGMEAATALVSNRVDVAMLSGDSTTRELMQRLLGIPGISVMSFDEQAAYTRLFPYLESIDLPAGVLDLSRRVPPQTVHMIGPTVEIVARNTLHPAISDLIIEAADEVNGVPGLLQRAGEFPSPVAHDFRISEDASRYYKSGKSFLYRTLPFWLASVTDRLLVLLLPLAVLVFPALRAIPALYRWRVRSRIYRYYGALIAIERDALKHTSEEERRALIAELDEIESALNTLRMPLAYADAFYVLREHVGFVRMHLSPGHKQPEGAEH